MARHGLAPAEPLHVWIGVVATALSAILASTGAPAAAAQPADPIALQARSGPLRVIAPVGAARAATLARVIRAARIDEPFPGLPRDALGRAGITISLALRVRDDREAWTSADDGLIVLRLADAEAWPGDKLRRVVRHELAHVGLARALGFAKLPRWLSEGYSEWVSGGVSCEGEVRLHVYLRVPRTAEGAGSGGEPFTDISDPRVAYDAYASFFDYLETTSNAGVSDGRFFANVRAHGVLRGVIQTFGIDLPALERQWREYAQRRYANALNTAGPVCQERTDPRFGASTRQDTRYQLPPIQARGFRR